MVEDTLPHEPGRHGSQSVRPTRREGGVMTPSVEPDDRPILLPLGERTALEQLIGRHRAALSALTGEAPDRERGALHLAIGLYLAGDDDAPSAEAVEELRLALTLLSEEDARLDHAAARYHLGGLLLHQAMLAGPDRAAEARAAIQEAGHHLEHAHRIFAAEQVVGARVEATRRWSNALAARAEHGRAYALLERERGEHADPLRTWVELCLAGHALGDPDRQRQEQGMAILVHLMERVEAPPPGAQDVVVGLLGAAHPHLPPAFRARALDWMERLPDAPIELLIALRAGLDSDHPERWMTPVQKATLVTAMDDPAASVVARAKAAYTLLGALRGHDPAVGRRAIEIVEAALDAPEVPWVQKLSYRHDAAMALSLRKDAPSLERAARHLAIVLVDAPGTADHPIVTKNLQRVLLDLLDLRAGVSSPALLEIVDRIEALTADLPPSQARELRLGAATSLLRLGMLSHPACVERAGALIGRVLTGIAEDPDAQRMLYWWTWIRHQQGSGEADAVERALSRARTVGPVTPTKPPDPTERALAAALAGNGSLEGLDLARVAPVVRHRPDAVECVLDEVERRLGVFDGTAADLRALVRHAMVVLTISAPGNEGERGRRVAAMLLGCAPRLTPGEIADLARSLTGPAAEPMRSALLAAGISLDGLTAPAPVGADHEERVSHLQGVGVERMNQGKRRVVAGDEAAAGRLFEEAQRVLDEARALAAGLDAVRRAQVQISAGNARRLRAKCKGAPARVLLDEAEALYRAAQPWTAGHEDIAAQLNKVLADTLIQGGAGGRWPEAMELYRSALAGRPTGFMRWDTLAMMVDAELVCPDRPRALSLRAALKHLDEALDHVAADEVDKRRMTATRMLLMLNELSADGGGSAADIERVAARIEAAEPSLAAPARLAARGLAGELTPEAWMTSELVRTLWPTLGLRTLEALRDAAEVRRRAAHGETPEARAGRLVGRARILERIEEHDARVREARTAACTEAEAAARALEDPGLRAMALGQLALAWQHPGPENDFARSVKLLDEALLLLPANWIAGRADLTSARARATRYRADIPAREAVEAAITGYREAALLYRRRRDGATLAETLKNLAEALSARQDRHPIAALREAIEVEQEAIALARDTEARFLPELLANHAFVLTRLAQALGLPVEERASRLEEAGRYFEAAARINKDPKLGRAIANNLLVWQSAVAGAGDRSAVIQGLRDHLRTLDPNVLPREWAMAMHNLANELFDRSRGTDDLSEAIDLLRRALPLRPRDAEPRFHWETAGQLGELLATVHGARNQRPLALFRLTATSARSQAAEHLRSALRAARSLGPGYFVARTASFLGQLAADVDRSEAPDLAMAGEALEALEEVLTLSPEDANAAEAETTVATAVAGALARHWARTAPIQAATVTGATALHGSAAWEVLHWLLRARGGQHRRLRARMVRPEGVPPESWTRWRLALRRPDAWDERRAALGAVREACPTFLSGEPDLRATLAWIEATGGTAAMLLETHAGRLLAVLAPGEARGEVRPWVILLRGGSPSISLPELLGMLRNSLREDAADAAREDARAALDRVLHLLRAEVLPDLLERLADRAGPLLWSPHGVAAGVPLGLVCEKLRSIWTSPCLTLPPPLPAAIAPSSALLVLAEPDNGEPIRGTRAIGQIARNLTAHLHRVDVLLGQGREIGHRVAGDVEVPGLVTTAGPTPDEVVRRLADHRLILILAHGYHDAEHPEKSAFALVGPGGQAAFLTAERLAEQPDLLRRAVLVLLSCETGAAGVLSAAPAGLAGALLAVGAAAVVAPLWPVRRDEALLVGKRVMRAIATGTELGEAVQTAIRSPHPEEDGGPPYEAATWSKPFVAWTG